MNTAGVENPGRQVLVVDDDEMLRDVLDEALRLEGFQVAHAGGVEAVRAAYEDISPDVVVLDWKLPDGDGLQLMPEFKRVWPDAQFIIMTGFATFDAAFEAARRGAFRFLTKPFRPTELIAAITAASDYKGKS